MSRFFLSICAFCEIYSIGVLLSHNCIESLTAILVSFDEFIHLFPFHFAVRAPSKQSQGNRCFEVWNSLFEDEKQVTNSFKEIDLAVLVSSLKHNQLPAVVPLTQDADAVFQVLATGSVHLVGEILYVS